LKSKRSIKSKRNINFKKYNYNIKDPADCCLREINFEMYNKGLTAIVGSVGAGKVYKFTNNKNSIIFDNIKPHFIQFQLELIVNGAFRRATKTKRNSRYPRKRILRPTRTLDIHR
jgi:hypothetical protein